MNLTLRCLTLFLLLAATRAPAVTFTVTSAGDANGSTCAANCSLRQAINDANRTSTADTIAFAIAGAGPHTIVPTLALPTITAPLTINGYSQPGSLANTLEEGSDAVVQVRIHGSSAPAPAAGLAICSGGVTVRGLSITSFNRGIAVGFDDAGSGCAVSGATTIAGNFIGLQPDGSTGGGNVNGILGVSGITVGGVSPADRNLIGMNSFGYFGTGASILGNFFGTDRSGRGDRGNGVAVQILEGAAQIGGAARNRIAFNGTGVLVVSAAQGVQIGANDIGPNDALGIDLSAIGTADGATANDSNDVDEGGNRLQNFPQEVVVQRSADGLTLAGRIDRPATLATLNFQVRVYSSVDCSPGHEREGERYLGEFGFTSSGPTQEQFSGRTIATTEALPDGTGITLTATDADGNTSEFSDCVVLGAGAPVFTVNKVADTADGLCNADCSLREAILAANAAGTGARIEFAIPGAGPHAIVPASGLPTITAPVSIDGYTQPGATPNTLPGAMNATLQIVLDGRTLAGSPRGLAICARDSSVRGLSVIGFARGIAVGSNSAGGLCTTPISGVAVIGNYVGLGADGFAALPNLVESVSLDRCENCRVGGVALVDANALGGLGTMPDSHIRLGGSPLTGTRIDGNLIGSANNGAAPRGALVGIHSVGNGVGVAVGSLAANRIRFNGNGVVVGASSRTIEFFSNLIAENVGEGIDIVASGSAPDGPTGNDGNDGDSGGNDLQNHPQPVSASLTGSRLRVQATLDVPAGADAVYRIAIYRADSFSCDETRGQGEQLLRVVTARFAGSAEAFDVEFDTVPNLLGQSLVLTATDRFGNTSEFSPCVLVVDGDRLLANGFE